MVEVLEYLYCYLIDSMITIINQVGFKGEDDFKEFLLLQAE